MINQDYNWYASRTKSRAEFKAVEFLQKHGVDSFCPSTYIFRKWSDRIKRVIVPLFSQYIFTKISYKELLFLCECPGIAGFVKNGGEPDPIPEAQIRALKLLCDHEDQYEMIPGYLRNGQSIQVIAGPFIGQVAEIISAGGRNQAYIRIGTTGLAIRIPLSQVQLIKLPSDV